MATDRSRIVEIDPYTGQPTLILDMESFETDGKYYRERDSFQFTPPSASGQSVTFGGWRGGDRTTSVSHDNGTLAMTFRAGSGTVAGKDVALRAIADLVRTVDEHVLRPRRYFEWRPVGATKSSFFEVRGPGTWSPQWNVRRFNDNENIPVQVSWPVAPYAVDLPLKFIDPMGTESLAREWTVLSGTPNVSNFSWLPAAGTTKAQHNRHLYGSHERIAARFVVPDTIPATAQHCCIILRMSATDQTVFLAGRIRMNTSAQIDLIRGEAGGSTTTLGTPVAVTLSAGSPIWLVTRIEGNVVTVEYYNQTFVHPEGTPTNTFSHTLTSGDITTYGYQTSGNNRGPAKGRIGVMFTGLDATSTNRPSLFGSDPMVGPGGFRAEPCFQGSRALPDTVDVWNITGDLPPKMDVEVTDKSASVRPWFAVGWNSLMWNNSTNPPPFGVRDSANLTADVGTWSDSATAGAMGTTVKRHSLTTTGVASLTFPISQAQDSGGIDPDLLSEQTLVQVYALISMPNTAVTPRAVLSVSPDFTLTETFALEWGSGGKLLGVPVGSARRLIYRLGTIPVESLGRGRLLVKIKFTYNAASTGNLDLDWVWMTPASRSASVRTGLPLDVNFPKFFPLASGRKRVYSNLETDHYYTPTSVNVEGWIQHSGLGGAPIEPDVSRAGQFGVSGPPNITGGKPGASFTLASGVNVPDTTDTLATPTESYTLSTDVRFNIWPRFRFAVYE